MLNPSSPRSSFVIHSGRCFAALPALAIGFHARIARADWGTMLWGSGAPAVPTLDGWGLLLLSAVLVVTALLMLVKRRAPRTTLVLFVALVVPLAGYATTISMPYVFSNGTVADATQVNANFDELVMESNSQDLRLSTVEGLTGPHTHPGTDITSQVGDADTVDGAHAAALEESSEIDADIAAHAAISSSHHSRYTDAEALLAAVGVDAGTLDGLDSTVLEESAEIDADIAVHALNPSVHHTRYTDSEALAAAAGVDAGTLDGLDSLAFAGASHTHAYGKVAIVAQSGGNYTDPKAAMDDLATWCGTPSAANPCLVRIMPGIYDLGNNALTMQSYVDLEGSGESTTLVTSTHSSGTANETSATLVGADAAELRFFTVKNQGGASASIAVYNNASSPKMTNVTVTASGASGASYGARNINASSPKLTNVTATASNGSGLSTGVDNVSASSPTMTNVTATAAGGNAAYGVANNASSPIMSNVTASASGAAFFNYGVSNNATSSPNMTNVSIDDLVVTGSTIVVPASGSDLENGTLLLSVDNAIAGLGAPSAANRYVVRLDAGTYDLGNDAFTMQPYVDLEGSGENTTLVTSTHSSGSIDSSSATVVGASNAEVRFLTAENQGGSTHAIALYTPTAASPRITNVTVTAFGVTGNSYAVLNSVGSAPTLVNVTATASGGSQAVGIQNSTSSSPSLINVAATGSGGSSWNYGVLNSSAGSPTLTNVTASASGGTNSRGVSNNSSDTTMTSVTATASGGATTNYGVYNLSSSPTMTDVTATGSGGTTSHGVFNSSSSPILRNVSIDDLVVSARTILVPALGTDSENGTLLLSVDNAITELGAPSAANWYVIRLDFGTYDLGNNGFTMQPFVDLEGSHENSSIVTSTHSSGSPNETSATVIGSNDSQIRSLTVENGGGSTVSIGIYNYDISPNISMVSVEATGGISNYGIYNFDNPIVIVTGGTVKATGGTNNVGIYISTVANAYITDVTAKASGGSSDYGVSISGAWVSIERSRLFGDSLSFSSSTATTGIANTLLQGGAPSGVGIKCTGAYDTGFNSLNSFCL